ncbi:hypothetical protein RHOFW104T7_06620 [Rhodanobacter thiooxydans]|uniref:Uncharacterized protein n=1 Tax=Rhodanobacter thiooxydans TaxID=416169 RepID=A0A154QL40_9GAMM|nr:hypothetical protein [Rhodanobacter thiooxydans]KZC24861.1 hypothetical protein RHOFW104T7_06620 [Rhodanobacter thiooxydans]MCW0201570.1 hypothetical protein [Rhodanobacter thiooxydans]
MIAIVFFFGFLTSIAYLVLANIFIEKLRPLDQDVSEENFSSRNSVILMKYILSIKRNGLLTAGDKLLLLMMRATLAVGMSLYVAVLVLVFSQK